MAALSTATITRPARSGGSTFIPTIRWAIRRATYAERFQWTFPIVFDPHDPANLYVTSQHVWRTRNEGQSWERISPNLTRADPATLGPSGGPITRDQTGVETYATVFALAPSRLERGRDLGRIGRRAGARHPRQRRDLAERHAEAAAQAPQDHDDRGFAARAGHRLSDRTPLSARRLQALCAQDHRLRPQLDADRKRRLPRDEMARSIREDIVRPGLLFLGTERGVWVSFDAGARWHKLQRNLPAVQVSDLAVTDRDLVIATHGRSFWILDNIGVLRQLGSRTDRRLRLFTPAAAVRGVDEGVAIDYFLPSRPKQLSLDIFGADGKLIQSFAGSLVEDKKGEDEEEDGDPAKPKPPRQRA